MYQPNFSAYQRAHSRVVLSFGSVIGVSGSNIGRFRYPATRFRTATQCIRRLGLTGLREKRHDRAPHDLRRRAVNTARKRPEGSTIFARKSSADGGGVFLRQRREEAFDHACWFEVLNSKSTSGVPSADAPETRLLSN